MEIYNNWCEFFEALANKIYETYKNLSPQDRKDNFVKNIQAIEQEIQKKSLKLSKMEEDGSIIDCDPFSLFSQMACRQKQLELWRVVANQFGMDCSLNFSSVKGLTSCSPTRCNFFAFMVKRQPTDINTLWDCFFAAMEYSNVQDQTNREKFVTCFDNAVKVKETGHKKLTAGLSWIKPNFYVSLVGPNIAYLKVKYGVNISSNFNGADYLDYLEKLKNMEIDLVQLSIDSYKHNSLINEKDAEYDDGSTSVKGPKLRRFIVPIDSSIFDVKKCFEDNGFIVKSGFPHNCNCGDIAYIYCDGHISYKTKIVEMDTYDLKNFDDSKYILDADKLSHTTKGHIVKLELIKFNPIISSLTHKELKEVERNFSVQGINDISDKGKLIDYIETKLNRIDSLSNRESTIFDKSGRIWRQKNSSKGYNKIFYGVPGCGKSYYINKVVLNKLLGSIDYENEGVDNWEDSEYVFRTIFYQDYSHADFVGQYMPKRDRTTGNLTYEFVPKTFTQALQKAYENPDKNVVLIIEELNRGEAASIFGDLFQLLDRDDNGQSEYKINCDEIIDYFDKCWGKEIRESRIKSGKIYLPSNLYLLATMNTCDQNVFTLDTAFKRRWESEEIPNEFKPNSDLKDLYIPYIFTDAQNLSVKITWGNFVEVINDKIKNAIESEFFGDDRQIGCYFVKKSYLCDSTDIKDPNYISSLEYKEKSKKFANKILEYLWNDVAKVNKEKWFKSGIKTLHDAISAFENGKQVFADDLHTNIMNTKTTQTVQQQENTEEEVND